jgi:Big-like domain-containing protein
MSHALWTLGALIVAALVAHFPISWIVNNLYHGLGWPNEGASKRLPALVGVLCKTLLPLAAVLFCAACASDAGDLAPGAVCNAHIFYGENDEIIPVGVQRQFGFLYEPCDINDHAPRTVTWKTSNAGVATVTSTGLVTGNAVGTATITASTQGGSAGLNVQVVAP